ncbi:hypothetical protein C0J52_11107 [Blattella germanica]|nr:hypothetical protein C0J52_11107 [Blattella germanica]
MFDEQKANLTMEYTHLNRAVHTHMWQQGLLNLCYQTTHEDKNPDVDGCGEDISLLAKYRIIAVLLIVGNVEINPGPNYNDNDSGLKNIESTLTKLVNAITDLTSEIKIIRQNKEDIIQMKKEIQLTNKEIKRQDKTNRLNNLVLYGVQERGHDRNIDTFYIICDIFANYFGFQLHEYHFNNVFKIGKDYLENEFRNAENLEQSYNRRHSFRARSNSPIHNYESPNWLLRRRRFSSSERGRQEEEIEQLNYRKPRSPTTRTSTNEGIENSRESRCEERRSRDTKKPNHSNEHGMSASAMEFRPSTRRKSKSPDGPKRVVEGTAVTRLRSEKQLSPIQTVIIYTFVLLQIFNITALFVIQVLFSTDVLKFNVSNALFEPRNDSAFSGLSACVLCLQGETTFTSPSTYFCNGTGFRFSTIVGVDPLEEEVEEELHK